MEYKFRAWDNTPKEIGGQRMISWGELKQLDEDGLLTLMDVLTTLKDKGAFIPMQYTGLKDVNGVDIYDGDRVLYEMSCGSLKGTIKYDNARVRFGVQDDGGVVIYGVEADEVARRCKVIGNIHEEG